LLHFKFEAVDTSVYLGSVVN